MKAKVFIAQKDKKKEADWAKKATAVAAVLQQKLPEARRKSKSAARKQWCRTKTGIRLPNAGEQDFRGAELEEQNKGNTYYYVLQGTFEKYFLVLFFRLTGSEEQLAGRCE
ncbi:hypothetical protein I5L79_17870 [Hymenobacter sp. BT594]|uniref:Uncharacterized protein n=1 Tax=Hymenobacter guriensis TaxID=2793065 RepID=A0ABS0L7U3_9BACT|nr:hypothetical protein [Hymenobacter guriensis]